MLQNAEILPGSLLLNVNMASPQASPSTRNSLQEMTYQFCSFTHTRLIKVSSYSHLVDSDICFNEVMLTFCNVSNGLQHTILLASLNWKPILPCWPPWHQLCFKLLCSEPCDPLSWSDYSLIPRAMTKLSYYTE